jgi:CheY-like chemotaxis protein
MKIMAVDDSITTRLTVRRLFQALGHQVIEAAGGLEALALMRNGARPDVVILDWSMPGMSGLECLEQIRHDPALRDLKVIMCTTEAEKGQIVKAVSVGVDDYLVKPIDPRTLQTKVLQACGAEA